MHEKPPSVVWKPALQEAHTHDMPDGSLNVAQLLITALSPASHRQSVCDAHQIHIHAVHDIPLPVEKKPELHALHTHDEPIDSLNVAQLPSTPSLPASSIFSRDKCIKAVKQATHDEPPSVA